MTASDILFQTVSNLTGGLITDLTTAMLALVTIGFIVMALDYVTAPLQNYWTLKRESAEYELEYQKYKKNRHKREMFQNRYRSEMRGD